MEPDESRVPPPLRKDSRKPQNNHGHGHHGHGSQEHPGDDVKIQIKDIGKYGIPLDEWQKDDSSMSSQPPHPNHSRKSSKCPFFSYFILSLLLCCFPWEWMSMFDVGGWGVLVLAV